MMEKAIRDVSAGRAERICAPGLWVVWRDGDAVRVEVKALRAFVQIVIFGDSK